VHVLVGAPISGFLVGTDEPLVLDVGHIGRLLADPSTEGLRRHGMRDPYRLLSYLTADGKSLDAWLSDAAIVNTFEHPVLEFYSPREHAMPSSERNDENFIGLLASRIDERTDGYRVVGADPRRLMPWREAARALAEASTLLEASPFPTSELRALVKSAVRGARGNAVLEHTSAAILRRGIQHAPTDADLRVDLGTLLLESLGQPRAALAQYRRAAELRPRDAALRLQLGLVLRRGGNPTEAMTHLGEALRLDPDNPLALTATAEILATHPEPGERDPREAIARAERAAEMTGRRNAHVLSTLAAAQAAAGDFDSAVATARIALDLAIAAGATPLQDEIRRRLALFRERRPLGESR